MTILELICNLIFYHHVHSSLVDWSPRHKKKIVSLDGNGFVMGEFIGAYKHTHTHQKKVKREITWIIVFAN